MRNNVALGAVSKLFQAVRADAIMYRNGWGFAARRLRNLCGVFRRLLESDPRNKLLVCVTVTASFGGAVAKSQEYICYDGSPATSMDRASTTEYVVGNPQTILIKNNEKVSSIDFVDSDGTAVYQGDLILGNTSDIKYAAKLGPIDLALLEDASPDDPGSQALRPFANVLQRATKAGRWPNATIPYEIDENLPQRQKIIDAMKIWSDNTPIKFVERATENAGNYKNFVRFTKGKIRNACISDSVGMKGGIQHVYLVDGCEVGQILHELGHVIALEHEMTRHDRDRYVKINISNIIRGYESQFNQYAGDVDVGSYDYDSVMHYEPNAFTCNGMPTISAIQSGVSFGQRDHLSVGDIAAVKGIYK